MAKDANPAEVYELMEHLNPRLHELRPLDNSHDMEDFEFYQALAEKLLRVGYRKCPE